MLKNAFLYLIRLYRRLISPLLPQGCRFHPSCSSYAEEAVLKKGIFAGLVLSILRLARCHPFHPGGFDPVE